MSSSKLHSKLVGNQSDLPTNWELCDFGEIANVENNLVDPKSYGHLPHIALKCIEKHTGRLLNYKTIEEDGVTSNKQKFKKGQVLYGKLNPYLNKVIHVDFEGLCSSDIYPISTNQNPRWLWLMMLSPMFLSQATFAQAGDMPRINKKTLEAIRIPTPPLTEQDQIAEIVDQQFLRLENATKNIQRIKTKAEQFRRSLLHAAFTGTLTGSGGGVEENELPIGWSWRYLGDLVKTAPKVLPEILKLDRTLSYIPMSAVAEVSGEIDMTQTISSAEGRRRSLKYFADGDIIFAKITPCMENGKIARPLGLTNGAAYGSTEFHVFRPSSEIDGEFLRLFLVNDDFRQKAKLAMTGAVGQRRVPKKYMESYLMSTPSLLEQERIVKILNEKLRHIEVAFKSISIAEEKISQFRRSLLHSAFTGKLTTC